MEALGASRVKTLILFLLGFVVLASAGRRRQISDCQNSNKPGSFHDLSALDLEHNHIPFNRYEGKVVLVVNVATF